METLLGLIIPQILLNVELILLLLIYAFQLFQLNLFSQLIRICLDVVLENARIGIFQSVVQVIDSVIFFPQLHVIVCIFSGEELTESIWLSHFAYIYDAILGPHLIRLIFFTVVFKIPRFRFPVLS